MTNSSLRPEELPYVSDVPTDGRKIPALAFLDERGIWHAYASGRGGTLAEIRVVDAVAIAYFCAGRPATARDWHLPLLHHVAQHFSFQDTWTILNGIQRDYLNALACLHKYFVLSNYAQTTKSFQPHVLVATDLEFAFGNHRAFYDLLHALAFSIYRRSLIEDSRGRRLQAANMPGSFSRVLSKSDADLANKFHLPAPLIAFYRGRADVFGRLCKIRDNITHHGHSADFMFTLPEGFAVSLGDKMWADLHALSVWPPNLVKPNGLASVLGLLVFLIDDMDAAMASLVKGLAGSFTQLPQALADGYNVYLRDQLLVHRTWLTEYRDLHWCNAAAILQRCSSEWSKPADSGLG